MKILILDDDKNLLITLKKMLDQYDYDVDCSNNAEEAIEIIKNTHYDFILVDYKMPGNDGLWFLKNATLPRSTKILLITAFINREIINKMFKLGASGYLIKPFNEEDLIRHINFFSK